jgi:alpha-tubulin suppressor-like RCC1 family protein
VDLPAGVSFSQVISGGYTSYGITASGALWSWGANKYGQLGNGSTARIQRRPAPAGAVMSQLSSTAANVAGYSN